MDASILHDWILLCLLVLDRQMSRVIENFMSQQFVFLLCCQEPTKQAAIRQHILCVFWVVCLSLFL